jgi:hypothetical protein
MHQPEHVIFTKHRIATPCCPVLCKDEVQTQEMSMGKKITHGWVGGVQTGQRTTATTAVKIICLYTNRNQSRDSSVGIALGYGLDDRGSRVLFPAGAGNFSFHHRVQNGSGTHPASYPMGIRGSFPRGKAAGA